MDPLDRDSMAAPPPELMEEILVRLPPEDPASLVRAALVCKPWCSLVSGTAFRRRFREFHLHRGGAPLLGVLHNRTSTTTTELEEKQQQQQVRVREDDDDDDRCVKRARILREPTSTACCCCFVPTTSFHAANNSRRAIDARHGRVLLRRSDPSLTYGRGLSVWDPVTDEHHDLPEPSFNEEMLGCHWTAAVACAATGAGHCDHLDCHRGGGHHFLVVVMDVQDHVIYRAVYSSEAGAWSGLDVLKRPQRTVSLAEFRQTPSVLVGTALYFLIHCSDEVLEYDLATQDVSTIDLPLQFYRVLEKRGLVLVTDDHAGLGFVANTESSSNQLELWSMVDGGEGGFVKTRDIHLQKLLPAAFSSGAAAALINNKSSLRVNGFGFTDGGATGSRFLFIRTPDGLYSLEINSSHVRKVASCCGDDDQDNFLVPYISFCTPNSHSRVVQV